MTQMIFPGPAEVRMRERTKLAMRLAITSQHHHTVIARVGHQHLAVGHTHAHGRVEVRGPHMAEIAV